MTPDITCTTCRDLMPAFRSGTLEAAPATRIAQHLTTCATCQQVAAEWDAIIATTRSATQALPPDTTSAATWESLRRQLPPRAVVSTERKNMSAPIQSPPSAPTPVIPSDAPLSHPPRWAAWVAVASVIAASAIIFGLILPHLHTSKSMQPAGTVSSPTATVVVSTSNVTPGPNQTPITGIGSYAAINRSPTGSLMAKNPATTFHVNDFIYIVMATNTAVRQNDVFSARWYFNGQEITSDLLKTKPDCCSQSVAQSGQALQVLFAIKVPQAGDGKAQIYYNQQLAYTVLFQVEP